MSGGEIMIIGKLVLTFGCLLGLPILDLVLLERERRRRRHAGQDTSQAAAPTAPQRSADGPCGS